MTSRCAIPDAATEVPAAASGLWRSTLLLVAGLTVVSSAAHAQDAGHGYLFGAPHGTVTIRTGYDAAMANSDLFSFVMDTLTLKKSDFSGPTISTDFAVPLNPRVSAVLGLGYARSVARSEFRNWLDNNNLPIQQQTEFTRIPLSLSLKAYLEPPGRTIGHYAWVPSSVAPYVGAGLGTMWYKFRQSGDFIDFTTTNVFNDVLSSSGWTPMVDVFGGAEFSINQEVALTTEARYAWAQGPLSGDFVGFHRIDLSGVSLTAGLTFRY